MWTDGSGSVTFRAYDTNDNLLGTLSSNTDDHSFYGGTAEDRFFGVTNAAGIKSIFLSNEGGGIEMDHLQYGGGTATSGVPEPGTIGLAAAGLIGLVLLRRRRTQIPS